jgi:transcriptional regulator with XRE-family HTH domain
MRDVDLRKAILDFRKKYGTSITFIASQCGVSREHLSRWIHNDNYSISPRLKKKIRQQLNFK